MFSLRNLSSQQIELGCDPWAFQPESPIPDEVRIDKKERDAWINNPQTEHHVYTLCEGVNSSVRISRLRSDGEGNPVHAIHGLVADYDSKQPEETVERLACEMPYPPNWVEKTLSGHWRYVWLFEKPIAFPSFEFARHFLKKFDEFAFDPKRGMVGFDQGAWNAPERLYTNSCDWRACSPDKLPESVTQGWMVKASQTFKFTTADFGLTIPLEIVAPELAKLFPKFSQWPGDFSLNSQGPSFWIEASQSPKSAIVRETGMQTFSANAAKAFYTWKDLLGDAFVKEYEAKSISAAVEGIYHDGKHYFRQLTDKVWKSFETTDLSRHLRTSRKVSPKTDGSGVSETDRCIEFIQSYQSVQGCAPFCFRAPGIIRVNRQPFLNTSTLTVLPPAAGPVTWGPTGEFPWLSGFLDGFFSSAEQLPYFLSWLHRFYVSGLNLRPVSGQNIFLAGEVGVGKTFLARAILARMMGGFQEAKEYLLGKDNFGSELFESPLWGIDDGSTSTDPRAHRQFSEMIKRMAANRTFRYHAKFRIPLMVDWQGRVVITCNCDEESIRQIPDLEISIRDKISLFRTAASPPVTFPDTEEETEAILNREMPFFCAFIRDYKIPAELRGLARFGVKSYLEKSLVETSRLSSRTAGFAEILVDWKQEYFGMRAPKAEFWEGTASQLYKQILLDPTAESLMRRFDVDAIGRHLSAMKNKGARLEASTVGDVRVWKIFRDQKPTPPTP